jgi:3-deoxy-D-manno-octulosonic-acid transferase
MIRYLYTFILSLLLLAIGLPLLPLLLCLPSTRRGLSQRLGILPREVRDLALVGQGSLWIHAASLGEVNAIAEVARLLTEKLSSVPLLFTCTTLAGTTRARQLFPKAAAVVLLPLDLPLFLNPLFNRFKPRFAVIAETELWPNFLHGLRESGCQLLLANGRMTQRSLRRYLWFKPLFASSLRCFETLAMQSEADADRVIQLGAKPTRVVVMGNTKFDLAEASREARKKAAQLRLELGLEPGEELIVAGSTRPGEESMLLEVFSALKKERRGLKLMLAPRHLERMGEVARLIEEAGFSVSRRSLGKAGSEVILLDSLGELMGAYLLATLAWIGGSWEDWGGQNPIEAAAQGVPVLFGPHMQHFKEPATTLLEAGAAWQGEAKDLFASSLGLLKDSSQRESMGKAGLEACRISAGASKRCADLAWKLAVVAKLRLDEHDWRSQSAFASLKISEFGSSLEKKN